MEDNSINPGLEANQIVSPENLGTEPAPKFNVEPEIAPETEPEVKKVKRDSNGHFAKKK